MPTALCLSQEEEQERHRRGMGWKVVQAGEVALCSHRHMQPPVCRAISELPRHMHVCTLMHSHTHVYALPTSALQLLHSPHSLMQVLTWVSSGKGLHLGSSSLACARAHLWTFCSSLREGKGQTDSKLKDDEAPMMLLGFFMAHSSNAMFTTLPLEDHRAHSPSCCLGTNTHWLSAGTPPCEAGPSSCAPLSHAAQFHAASMCLRSGSAQGWFLVIWVLLLILAFAACGVVLLSWLGTSP